MLQNHSPLEILIAEDMEDAVLILLSQLKKFDCKAKVVGTGLQAVDAALEKDYDIIFMDIRMPGMDGIQATKHILHNCANRQKKPYITAMTSFGHYHDRFLEAGISEVMLKPVSLDQIGTVLAKVMAFKEAETEEGL
ncbi:response regulator [Paenibacillus illinoisensis]|uniref:Multi-sensor hybrid histidine kinase n=1 Tax=Paenibacillus illinoisensis TaxID=59845 RepID=A0A2W0CAR2_9BACL|nr:response regulator [Paenibacillus illinoisensis]PYY29666.1 Multi-sensor hybrid histidine kinase [Paenibacillus illinoisensis]